MRIALGDERTVVAGQEGLRSKPEAPPDGRPQAPSVPSRRQRRIRVAGSDRGADRAAFMATLLTSAKLNDVDPQA